MGNIFRYPRRRRSRACGANVLVLPGVLIVYVNVLHLLTMGMEHRETIVNIGALLFYLTLIFCSILVAYDELPKFWTFMYWLSPITYLIRDMFAVGIAHKTVEYSAQELSRLVAPKDLTCHEYLGPFIDFVGGAVSDLNAIGVCSFCPLAQTDELLKMFKIEYKQGSKHGHVSMLLQQSGTPVRKGRVGYDIGSYKLTDSLNRKADFNRIRFLEQYNSRRYCYIVLVSVPLWMT